MLAAAAELCARVADDDLSAVAAWSLLQPRAMQVRNLEQMGAPEKNDTREAGQLASRLTAPQPLHLRSKQQQLWLRC